MLPEDRVREAILPLVATIASSATWARAGLKDGSPNAMRDALARIIGQAKETLDAHEEDVADGLLEGESWFVGGEFGDRIDLLDDE